MNDWLQHHEQTCRMAYRAVLAQADFATEPGLVSLLETGMGNRNAPRSASVWAISAGDGWCLLICRRLATQLLPTVWPECRKGLDDRREADSLHP